MIGCMLAFQVAFVIGGLRRQTSTLKPFNPILGETYQGVYSSGVRVHAEQISHHPPVSSWQVADPDGKVSLTDICTPTNLSTNLLRSAPNRLGRVPSIKTVKKSPSCGQAMCQHLDDRVSMFG